MVGPIKQLEENKRSLTNAQQISKDMDQYWKEREKATGLTPITLW